MYKSINGYFYCTYKNVYLKLQHTTYFTIHTESTFYYQIYRSAINFQSCAEECCKKHNPPILPLKNISEMENTWILVFWPFSFFSLC